MSRAPKRAPVVLCAAAATFLAIQAGSASLQDADDLGLSIEVREGVRHVSSNGLPNHSVGAFEDPVREQTHRFQMPERPQVSRRTSELTRGYFGIALNGVVFDPSSGEHWSDNRRSGWTYETVTNKAGYGLDMNNGHVGDNGMYHYHGPPIGLLKTLDVTKDMRLLGYAADGFPIYDQFGYIIADDAKSGTRRLNPSYRVKNGKRPSRPFGNYDGTFVEDWEYVEGAGDLDECNGRTGVTPEYPGGTYYYVITEKYPCVPRIFRGTPDRSFQGRRGRGGDFDW